MKLSLASLKVHLAHCANSPRTGHMIGLIFTQNGTPNIVAVPAAR